MSKGLKIYAGVLGSILLLVLFNLFYEPSEVRALNAILKQDSQLAKYAYPFRVLDVENGVAVMSSPRSASMPVSVMISAIDPALQGVDISSTRYLAAQQTLAEHQSRAAQLIKADPHITRINWQLDAQWLRARGISVPY